MPITIDVGGARGYIRTPFSENCIKFGGVRVAVLIGYTGLCTYRGLLFHMKNGKRVDRRD